MTAFQNVQQFVQLSRSAADLDALKEAVADAAHEFGIEYFLLAHHVNAIGPKFVQLSNYPADWSNEMRKKAHFARDPVMWACQKTVAPFLWSELGNYVTLTTAQVDILERASRAGVGPGFTVPFHVPGECSGSCSFAVRTGRNLDTDIIPFVQHIACYAFDAARRLSLHKEQLQGGISEAPGLTERQLDCIVLMAQGKSDWDIGKILSISQRTVQEHLDLARAKYGVGSRTQLLARVLYANQIGFEDIIQPIGKPVN